MEPKIIKDFLEPKQFEDIKQMFYLPTFPWYLNKVLNENEERQFTHSFYLRQKRNSDFFPFLRPFLKKLNMFILVKAKANLLLKTPTIVEHGFHKDFDLKHIPLLTAVYYINTNNGYTKLKNGTNITSVANTMVVFDTQQLHTGSTCTDEDHRIVLNFNYIEGVKDVP
tara:strand:- start:607 stop:1110 length:504 start_codon:yes stop_codon:yes gene_type:complete